MQILALEVENTKSYTAERVDFTEGVNAIVGHNGAGKSTILEAIGFALFDAMDYKHTEFVRDGSKSASVTVTIASNLDERHYQVVRRCGSVNQHYIFDPELQVKICEGKADVLSFLRQHMGVDSTTDLTGLFRDAVGVPQGTFTSVFLEPAGRRKSTFDPLLRVEEYKQAVDKLLEPQKLLQKRQQQMEVEIKGLETRLERLPILESMVQQRALDIATASTTLQQTEQLLQRVQIQRESAEAIQQKANTLRQRMAQIAQRQQSQEGQLHAAEAAQQQAAAARTAMQQNMAGYELYLEAQLKQKALEGEVRQRQQMEAERAKLDKQLALRQADWAAVQRELNEVAEAEKTIVELAPAVQMQVTLERSLSLAQQQHARLDDMRAQSARQEQELQRLRKRLTELNLQLERAQTLDIQRLAGEEQLTGMLQTLEEHRETLARCKADADTIKQQNSALEGLDVARCPVCEQPLAPEQRAQLLERNAARLVTLRAEYAVVQQQSKSVEAGQKMLQADIQRAQQELRRLPRREEATTVQSEIETTQAALAQLVTQVGQWVNAPQQVTEITAQLAALNNPSQRSAIAAERAQRRPGLEEKGGVYNTEIKNIQKLLTATQQALAQFATLDAKLENVATDLQLHTNAYQTVLLNRQMAEMLEIRSAEVEQCRQTLKVLAEECQTVGLELATVEAGFDASALQRVVAEEQRLRNQQGGLHTQITMLQQDQTRDAAEIEALRLQQTALVQAQRQRQQLTAQEEALDNVRSLLRQAGPYVTKALVKQISDGAAQIFGDIMQDYSRHLNWNEEYGITLEVDGRPRQFAQLSGGEQMTAALGVRLALLREISNIDVAFFDEPTTNLDETRRSSLARQILDVKGFRQLFVISHDDTFEQATQNLIRIARVNGTSIIMRE